MPSLSAQPVNDPTWSNLFDSPLKDSLIRRRVTDAAADRMVTGEAPSPSSKFPGFELAGFEPDEAGYQWAWYVKPRTNQNSYNWTFSETFQDEFGARIEQAFILKRDGFVPSATDDPPPTFEDAYTWTFYEDQTIKLPMPLHGLYTAVNRVWRDTTNPVVSQSIDPDTGARRTTQRTLVPIGTLAQPIGNTGSYSTVRGITPKWMVQTIEQAAGIAGDAVNGISIREIERHVRFYWPPVLDWLFHRPTYEDEGNAFSQVTGHLFYEQWAADGYSGSCKATLTERWTRVQPKFAESGGDAGWPTTGTNPLLPEPTVLEPKPVRFQGTKGFYVSIESCLHQAMQFRDESFVFNVPATSPARRPGSILADVDNKPFLGGWVSSWVNVKAPSSAGQGTGLTLSVQSAGISSVVLAWDVPGSGTTLDVSTTPDFTRGFVKKDQAVNSTAPLTYTLTGLQPDKLYFARLKRTGDLVSNIVQFMPAPQSLLVVLDDDGDELASAATVAFGDGAIDTDHPLTFTLRNDGVLPMEQISASLSGADASSWSVSGVPSSLARGASAEITLTFRPEGATGAKVATLSLSTDDPASPFTLSLTGTATDPEINLKYLGTSYATGNTVPLSGSVNTGSSSNYTLVIENTGTGTMPVQVSVSGTGFTLITAPESVAAGGSENVVVTFAPTAGGTIAGTLNIVNTDRNENPYTLTLNGTGAAVGEIEVQDPLGVVMTTGASTYDFGTVDEAGATTRTKTITIYNRGAGTLSSLSASKSGTNSGDFTLSALGASSLAGGASTTFTIGFNPSATGARTATISIASNDSDENPFTFVVNGTGGTGPDIQVEQPAPTIIADNGSLDFGSVLASGSNTVVKVFTIRNLGTSDLSVTAVGTSGTNSADFVVSGITPTVAVPADTTTTFSVTFNPSGLGTRTATLTITNNASSAPKQSYVITLNGTGIPANALTTYQSASVVVGQADMDDQLTSGTGITPGIVWGAAVSSTGRLALASHDGTAVFIYNSVPATNGTMPDVILTVASPTGVAWSGNDLLVCEIYNNRVLRYAGPQTTGMSPTNVIGQPNLSTTTAGLTAAKLEAPMGVMVTSAGKLIVCDTSNSRLLIWNSVPTTNGVSANVVTGQANFTSKATGNSATRMQFPKGAAEHPDGKLLVVDGNSRVLVYPAVPTVNDSPASYVLLHPGFGTGASGATQSNCDIPYGVACSDAGLVAVADVENDRVMIYYEIPTISGQPAHAVLGQSTLTANTEWGGLGSPNAQVMRRPYGVCFHGNNLIVTGNMKRGMIFFPA